MEDLREMGKKYFDLTNPNVSDIFDLVLDTWFGNQIKLDEVVHRLKAIVHQTKEDKDRQEDNTYALEKSFQRMFDFCSSAAVRSVQQTVARNAEGIPLDWFQYYAGVFHISYHVWGTLWEQKTEVWTCLWSKNSSSPWMG